MSTSRDRSHIYEVEAKLAEEGALINLKCTLLQIYAMDPQKQLERVENELAQIQKEVAETEKDVNKRKGKGQLSELAAQKQIEAKKLEAKKLTEAKKLEEAEVKSKLEIYRDLSNKLMPIMKDSLQTTQNMRKNIQIEKQAISNYQPEEMISKKAAFMEEAESGFSKLAVYDSDVNAIINKNTMLGFSISSTDFSQLFKIQESLLKDVKDEKSKLQIEGAYEKMAMILSEKKNTAIHTDAIDLSSKYVKNKIELAEISLQKSELADKADRLTSLSKIKKEISGIEDEMKKASYFKRRQLGKELVAALKGAAYIAAASFNPQILNEDLRAKKLDSECNLMANAKKLGINNNTLRESFSLIERAEKTIENIQQKINEKRKDPNDVKALLACRELIETMENIERGIKSIYLASNNNQSQKANRDLSSILKDPNTMLKAEKSSAISTPRPR